MKIIKEIKARCVGKQLLGVKRYQVRFSLPSSSIVWFDLPEVEACKFEPGVRYKIEISKCES